MQVTLPTKTAGEVTLPGGLTVWVQTVNAWHRDLAREGADLYAARATRPYRKGGDGYTDLQEQFEDGGTEFQVKFVADCGYIDGTYQSDAEKKFPLADYPIRNDNESDEAYDKRVANWDDASAKVAAKRGKHIESAYETCKRNAEQLSDTDRIVKCCDLAYKRRRQELFGTRLVMELLARGVRAKDDHNRMVYASADEVAELEDDVRDVLSRAYFYNDGVSPSEIPTLAG